MLPVNCQGIFKVLAVEWKAFMELIGWKGRKGRKIAEVMPLRKEILSEHSKLLKTSIATIEDKLFESIDAIIALLC